jgi:hypothetical protein
VSEERGLGPLDFILLEFPDQDNPTGQAATELRALVDHGVIRLYDIVAVRKDSDGKSTTFDLGELSNDSSDGFAYFAGASSGLLSQQDISQATAALNNGTVGVLLVYENAWAEPFVTAARASGGTLVATSRVSAQDLIETLDTLDNNTDQL